MTDNRRHGTMDRGRHKLKLPVYWSTNIITQNMSLEEAASALDNALSGSSFLAGDVIMLMYPVTSPLLMRVGFFECNGAILSPGTYPELFSAIQYRWGNVGGNFLLPDLRGKFLRVFDGGVSGSAGVDPGRAFGPPTQQDAMYDHLHDLYAFPTTEFYGGWHGIVTLTTVPTGGSWTTQGVSGLGAVSPENRPINDTFYAIIKY